MVRAPLRYELRLGVVGHRTIADAPALARTVQRLLEAIASTLNRPGAGPLSWTIVSPLARGADRLVSAAVLERPGGRLEVVTPFPLPEYRGDFEAGPDLAEFEDLLARAAQVREFAPTGRDGGRRLDRAEREIGYLRAGERVVDTCEILIAVWNGARRDAAVGGTATTIQYALEHERLVLWIDAGHPDSPPRVLRSVEFPEKALDGNAAIKSTAFPTRAKDLSLGYHQQAAYCVDRGLKSGAYEAALARDHHRLIEAATAAGLPVGSLDSILVGLSAHYARADGLAVTYQKKHTRALNTVLYLAAASVTVAVTQVLFFPEQVRIILFEMLGMASVFAVWRYSRREAWHQKWLHDRYLAERLRIAMFTTLAGLAPEDAAGNEPLPFYRGPQQWLAQTVAALTRQAGRVVAPLPLEPLRQFLVTAWLAEQQSFHARNADRKAGRASRRHWFGFGLFGATFLMALLHFLGVGHNVHADATRVLRLDLWITALAIVLPVWAAAVHAATAQLELERVAERSGRMANVLAWMAHRSQHAATETELREIVLEAAELMAAETHEWFVLLSFQDVRLHV
jgi:hypothetical protein